MKLTVEAELVYNFQEGTELIAAIEAAMSKDQQILEESLHIKPDIEVQRDRSLEGERTFRGTFSGIVTLRYRASVENGLRQLLPRNGRQHPWSELPDYIVPFLLPSRFCPSDKFGRFAQREFAAAGDGVARVMQVLDWLHGNVDYVHGVSTAETTAERTFVDRAGVCRDFTHLAITLCRALGIPARAVSAYALDLVPADFHAVFEVYLEQAWWLVDPTRLVAVGGIVRIGSGRDASDIAFLTTDKPCRMLQQTISVQKA